MFHRITIIGTLLVHILATCTHGVFVLCVHGDGQSGVEFAWAACCADDGWDFSMPRHRRTAPARPVAVEPPSAGGGCCERKSMQHSNWYSIPPSAGWRLLERYLGSEVGSPLPCTDYLLVVELLATDANSRNGVFSRVTHVQGESFVFCGDLAPIVSRTFCESLLCTEFIAGCSCHLRSTVLRC